MLANSKALFKRLSGTWRRSGQRFTSAQVRRLLIGGCLGCFTALLIHLLSQDHAFHSFVEKKWTNVPSQQIFDGVSAYKLELVSLSGILAVASAIWLVKALRRFLRAWFAGITSLVTFFAALITILLLRLPLQCSTNVILLSALLMLSLVACEWRRFHTAIFPKDFERTLPALNIPTQKLDGSRLQEHWEASSSDDPIQEWEQDIIGRASVVEVLAEHIFVQQTPVVALHGDFGDGKTSILNLLRRTIVGKAIVVSFSAWLPGSDKTLALDLFGDITTECKKILYVPQLKKQAIAYARTISGSVSYLAGLKEVLPSISQRQEIYEIRETLARVPLPIVVLLDEIDRMQRDELDVLFKILRGAASIPNVTFICAFGEKEIKKQISENWKSGYGYLEKFFPVSVNLAPPAPAMLGKLFQGKVKAAVHKGNWFIGIEEKKFDELLNHMWEESLSRICTNLRKAGLLLNDLAAAARPIPGEVNTLDLVGIEAIRRFEPDVYELIRKNGHFLTYGNEGWTKGDHRSPNEQAKNEFFAKLDAMAGKESGESIAIKGLVKLLFPEYIEASKDQVSLHSYLRPTNAEIAEQQKRICDADYFSIYFRAALPEEMYSEADLTQTINLLNAAQNEIRAERVFVDALNRIPPKHPKRSDFLWKLGRAVHSRLNDNPAEWLAYAVASNATEYLYDLMHIGEAARAVNIVFESAQKMSSGPKAQEILVGAIRRATDDTFAKRILEFTKEKDRNKILINFKHINAEQVADTFMERMRARYGYEVDADTVQIATGDWWAFRLWASNSAVDKKMEQDFWQRYINDNRKRLAQAINFFYPHGFTWSEDPRNLINDFFPMNELQRLFGEMEAKAYEGEEQLNDVESAAMERFRKLLTGKWFDISKPDLWNEESMA